MCRLFIEELTKTVLESGLVEERGDRYELAGPLPPLAIPNTLHDSLMARWTAWRRSKRLAQLGAAIGREFSYALLQAVSRGVTTSFARGPRATGRGRVPVRAGPPPQATYRFKHALIQEAAYQSLLKSTRQQHHQRIANITRIPIPRDRRNPA